MMAVNTQQLSPFLSFFHCSSLVTKRAVVGTISWCITLMKAFWNVFVRLDLMTKPGLGTKSGSGSADTPILCKRSASSCCFLISAGVGTFSGAFVASTTPVFSVALLGVHPISIHRETECVQMDARDGNLVQQSHNNRSFGSIRSSPRRYFEYAPYRTKSHMIWAKLCTAMTLTSKDCSVIPSENSKTIVWCFDRFSFF